jgi:Glycosyltransferase family 10 (fucosyltransferase) C-term
MVLKMAIDRIVDQRTINICSPHANAWHRQFPNGNPIWEGWRFVFNEDDNYDYLVVFDDLYLPIDLKCKSENTIHLATEPPSVHHYNAPFLSQFSWVVTQDKTVKHSGAIHSQPGLTWFIGWQPGSVGPKAPLSFEELEDLFDFPKTKLLSVIASNKTFTPEHAKRLSFAKNLKEHYGDQIDFYGRGFTPMDDKLDALRNYRFSVVLENSSSDDYFSEKLTDCLIAGTYPLYYGCPNLGSYFPADSFTRLNIDDVEKSIEIIDKSIADDLDKKNRQQLRNARDMAMHKHNLYPMLVSLIEDIEAGKYGRAAQPVFLDKQLLPFGSDRYKAMFSPKVATTMRSRLSMLSANNTFFRHLRSVYRMIRGRG